MNFFLTKKARTIADSRFCTRGRSRTGTSITAHGILSPARLPIPPPGLELLNQKKRSIQK